MENNKTYWALIEPRNGSPFVVRISSKTEKTPSMLFEVLEKQYDLDWDRDSATVLDEISELSID